MHIAAIHHFAIVVEDLAASVGWYESMLGFGLERRFAFASAGVEIAHVSTASGVRIELIQQAGSSRGPDVGQDAFGALKVQGAKHVGLLVRDIEAVVAELRNKGVHIVHDVTAVEEAGVKNCWLTDNSGNLIELNQWLSHPEESESRDAAR